MPFSTHIKESENIRQQTHTGIPTNTCAQRAHALEPELFSPSLLNLNYMRKQPTAEWWVIHMLLTSLMSFPLPVTAAS